MQMSPRPNELACHTNRSNFKELCIAHALITSSTLKRFGQTIPP